MDQRPRKPNGLQLSFFGTAAFLLASAGAKTNPGGPFVSIMLDITPTCVAILVLIAAVPRLRDATLYGRASTVVPMVPATFAIAAVIKNVMDFWTRAHARGDLLGL